MRNITEAEYNAAPGIRRSALFNMSKSPAHYKWALDHPQPDSPALLLGRAVHCAVLQPEIFDQCYAVAPGASKATKEGRKIWETFLQDIGEREAITQADYEKCMGIREAISNHPVASALLEGRHETSYFWTDELTGLKCKIRTDAEVEIGDTLAIVDVKTCADASTETFMREAVRHGYDLQAGMYCEGVSACTGRDPAFIFIAVEKTPPYAVNVLAADNYVILRGKDLFREYIGKVAACEESGNWFCYNGPDGDMSDLSLPYYLQKEYE